MWVYRALYRMRPLWNLYWRLRLEEEHPVPRTGPLLVAANHASFFDPLFLGLVFPRELHYLINRKWYDRSSLWRAFFRSGGAIPVTPGDPGATLATVARALRKGDVVCIFPEGRISADGRIGPLRSGIAYMAAATGVPVLPVGIRGAFDVFPRSRRFPRPGTVTAHTGPPLRFTGSPFSDEPRGAEVARFIQRLQNEISRLAARDPEADALPE